MRTNFFILSVLFSTAVLPVLAVADGQFENSDARMAAGATSKELGDKRLPAVMPGQEVEANGKKMNVWTTSGPVQVAQPPEPWRKDSDQIKVNANGLGVIIDQRSPNTQEGSGRTR